MFTALSLAEYSNTNSPAKKMLNSLYQFIVHVRQLSVAGIMLVKCILGTGKTSPFLFFLVKVLFFNVRPCDKLKSVMFCFSLRKKNNDKNNKYTTYLVNFIHPVKQK